MSRPRRRIVWPVLALLTILVIGGCGLLGFTTCNPPDRVKVFVENIPPNTRFLSIAADSPEGPVSLNWLWTYFGPHERHPATLTGVTGEPPRMNPYCPTVRWRTGTRYGVVMQTKLGEWKVAWFPADNIPTEHREAHFDLSKAEIVPLDADTVKALGLQDVKPFPK